MLTGCGLASVHISNLPSCFKFSPTYLIFSSMAFVDVCSKRSQLLQISISFCKRWTSQMFTLRGLHDSFCQKCNYCLHAPHAPNAIHSKHHILPLQVWPATSDVGHIPRAWTLGPLFVCRDFGIGEAMLPFDGNYQEGCGNGVLFQGMSFFGGGACLHNKAIL